MMKVTRVSPLTKKENTMYLDITPDQIVEYNQGAMVQDAFPNLNPDEREFIMTGFTPEDWEQMFGLEDEEEPRHYGDKDELPF